MCVCVCCMLWPHILVGVRSEALPRLARHVNARARVREKMPATIRTLAQYPTWIQFGADGLIESATDQHGRKSVDGQLTMINRHVSRLRIQPNDGNTKKRTRIQQPKHLAPQFPRRRKTPAVIIHYPSLTHALTCRAHEEADVHAPCSAVHTRSDHEHQMTL